jgi:ADP-ribosylglycohydrolase
MHIDPNGIRHLDASEQETLKRIDELAQSIQPGSWEHLLDKFEPAPNAVTKQNGKLPITEYLTGSILGAAIGDALGHPTEFLSSWAAIQQRFGDDGVTDYVLYWERDGKRFAPYTDDTQMAEVVLRALIRHKKYDTNLDDTMQRIADGLVEWATNPQGGHRAPGNACLAGCAAMRNGVHWSQAGGANAGGCGSVIRAFPFGLALYIDPQKAATWAAEHSKMTHGDPIALAACAAFAAGIAQLLKRQTHDPIDEVYDLMIAQAARFDAKTATMLSKAIDQTGQGIDSHTILDTWQGWAAHEALAAGLFLFAEWEHEAKKGILLGANATGDSDSIASIAGALFGARWGMKIWPQKWVQELERTNELQALGQALAEVATQE